MAIDYISSDTARLFFGAGGTGDHIELLWGDRVSTLTGSGTWRKVKARGVTGYVHRRDLGGASLLEFYFIDVGQGDGVLIRTPDHRHILIDGGWARARQDSGKNAADFVDWKFKRDYGRNSIEIDALIASHNDGDHYGGLWDLLNPDESHELDISDINIEAFYHAGVSWWKDGGRNLGTKRKVGNQWYLTRLLEDRASVQRSLGSGSGPKLQGEWAKFIERVFEARKKSGAPTPVHRLSHVDVYLPGFDGVDSDVAVRVLGPVEYEVSGKPALRSLGGNSQNTNGNSILLRVDYGRSRVLLTGDLNTKAQQALLEDYEGDRIEFQCDVAKACHHGSEDVSYEFMSAMAPAVTVISSGDNEGHDHPRPSIIAASATTGHMEIKDDDLVSPLIYSTELARSIKLADAISAEVTTGSEVETVSPGRISVKHRTTMAGGIKRTRTSRLENTKLVSGLVYGLVNVRTDGEKILCATMNEAKHEWQVKTIESRF